MGEHQIIYAQSQNIEAYLTKLPPELTLSIKAETRNGQLIFKQMEDKQVPSASIIKIPILIELLRQVEIKKILWKKQYILQETDKVGGAGNLQHQKSGTSYTIEELALEMIKESDNTATNILIRQIGMDQVNQLLAEFNCHQTKLQRLMMDFAAIKVGRQNYTSAADINHLLQLLLNRQLLNKKWSRKAIRILSKCADNTTIPSKLPAQTKIAHKTGTLDYFRGDSGIIFIDKDPIIISIFVEKFSSFSEAEKTIGTIAKIIYDTQINEK